MLQRSKMHSPRQSFHRENDGRGTYRSRLRKKAGTTFDERMKP